MSRRSDLFDTVTPTPYRPAGTILTPELYNGDINRYLSYLYPEAIDDFSDTDEQFQSASFNPYLGNTINKPQNLAQEIGALRHQIDAIIGKDQWYLPPDHGLNDLRPPPEHFTSTTAPESNKGSTGSLWIRQSGSTLSIYLRDDDGWPSMPQISLTNTSATGVNITVGTMAPTGGTDGDLHFQFLAGSVNFWTRSGGSWTSETFDGAAITAGDKAPTGGDNGDIHLRLAGSVIEAYKKVADVWESQASISVAQDFVRVLTTAPDGGADGDSVLQLTDTEIRLHMRANGTWSVTETFLGKQVKDRDVETSLDLDNDYFVFMDASDGGTPDKRILASRVRTALAGGSVSPGGNTGGSNTGGAVAGGEGAIIGETRKLRFLPNPIPTGWLEENGAAVSRTTYQSLFQAIGTTYGAGNGSTTFNLPNASRRADIGRGGSRPSGSAGPGTTVGRSGGSEFHKLTTSQMPSHTHSAGAFTARVTTRHQHPVQAVQPVSGVHLLQGGATRITLWIPPFLNTVRSDAWGLNQGVEVSGSVNNQGGGGNHNNMPPSLVVFSMIFAGVD